MIINNYISKIKHMKKVLPILLLIFPIILSAQVTINNSIFPKPGDTLRYVTDNFFTNFDPNVTGETTWDFRSLNGSVVVETLYKAASTGDAFALFPDADLLDKSAAQEIYYKSYGNKIVELGRAGLDPVLNILDLDYQNEGELILRRAPMSYSDNYTDNSSFMISAPTSVIPDSIIPGLSTLVDSLRLNVSITNVSDLDAWGTLQLPDADYEVLRQKTETTTNAELYIFTSVFGWQLVDPSNPLFASLGDILDLLGESISVSYQFFANDNKEVMANIVLDDSAIPISVTYKGDATTAVKVVSSSEQNILTYPNPTFGNVTFELKNLPKGNYKVEIYNIIGKKLWSADLDYFTGVLNTDISHLRKGTYLYSIIDGNGLKIATRRLMVITP